MRALVLGLLMAAQPVGAQTLGTANPPGELSYEDSKVLAGAGFTVSTSLIAVASGSYLNAVLTNTSATQSMVMTSRILVCNVQGGNAPTEYSRYTTAASLAASPTPTAVTVGNRVTGGAAIPATFSFQMGTGLPTGGAVSSSGPMPTGGTRLEIKEIVVVAPSNKLVYSIGGAGGGLSASARCSMTFLGYMQ